MNGLGDGDGMGFDMGMMNQQQQQLFGSYLNDGSQMSMPGGSMYADDSTMAAGDESNDAKRRRIARVRYHSVDAPPILPTTIADVLLR